MALTRKMLKAMGIEDEKIDQIIEAHTESTDALKQQRDEAKAQAADADKGTGRLSGGRRGTRHTAYLSLRSITSFVRSLAA